MFAIVVLGLLCSHQVFAAPGTDIHMDVEACMKETGSTNDEISAFGNGADASENLKCLMKCVMLKQKTMLEDGRLVLERMLEMMPSEQHAAITQCTDIEQGGELCDLAYRHEKCFREKSPEFYREWVKEISAH